MSLNELDGEVEKVRNGGEEQEIRLWSWELGGEGLIDVDIEIIEDQ